MRPSHAELLAYFSQPPDDVFVCSDSLAFCVSLHAVREDSHASVEGLRLAALYGCALVSRKYSLKLRFLEATSALERFVV